jgi:osmoprotectant transport system permease protein
VTVPVSDTRVVAASKARDIDPVAAFGAAVAVVACLVMPLSVFRANRIVAGAPHGALATGPAGWVLLAACVAALAVAVLARPAARARALPLAAAILTVALSWALGRAAVTLRAGQPDISRVSIGTGAWLVAAGCAVVWFASREYDGAAAFRRAGAVLAVAGFAGAALVGGLAQLSIVTEYTNRAGEFWPAVATHLALAGGSLALAIVIGVPLGVLSLRVGWLRAGTLGVVGLIQTVPSLALLGLLVFPLAALGLPGIGPLPATIALTLYALLPIVRNTYVGLSEVDPAIVDAGRGMGMSGSQLLLRVEAPLALPLVIEGVRSAAVLVIGIAAVVAFIGVGTLGVLVFDGWGQVADDLILLGAVPMVVLAVVADAGLRALSRAATSPGIR